MSRHTVDSVDGTDPRRAPLPRDGVVPDSGPRPEASASASIPDLLRRLSGEGSELVRQEIALAKAEMNEKIETMNQSVAAMAVGGGLMLAGLLFALWALNTGVTAALLQVVDAEIAVWLAPLLLAVVLLAVGWGLIAKGKSTLSNEGLVPEQSRESLLNDRRWAESKVEQAKAEVAR